MERRKKWDAKSDALKLETVMIVRLIDTPIEGTQAEVAKERLARWLDSLPALCIERILSMVSFDGCL